MNPSLEIGAKIRTGVRTDTRWLKQATITHGQTLPDYYAPLDNAKRHMASFQQSKGYGVRQGQDTYFFRT
jgi:hypothetical protein